MVEGLGLPNLRDVSETLPSLDCREGVDPWSEETSDDPQIRVLDVFEDLR